jgi:hypothetical protein
MADKIAQGDGLSTVGALAQLLSTLRLMPVKFFQRPGAFAVLATYRPAAAGLGVKLRVGTREHGVTVRALHLLGTARVMVLDEVVERNLVSARFACNQPLRTGYLVFVDVVRPPRRSTILTRRGPSRTQLMVLLPVPALHC